ncbi:hypothetical protein, partial [Bifidobacterium pseudocatenulatum]|uniref:hypothetical protein n=1 Tax=Bifidobacterium pseudocatenulatum TaxID=28026 RepID=UPI000A45999B
PSRVVLGFLPKDDEGEISESRTEEQGTTTITKFTGNDVTAWVSSRSGSVSGTGGWRTRVCGFGGVRFWFSSGTLVSFGVG